MIFHPHLPNSGLRFLAFFGLLLVIPAEIAFKAAVNNPALTAPRSWWLMFGYVVA